MLVANFLSRYRNGFCGADKGPCHFGMVAKLWPQHIHARFRAEADVKIVLVQLPELVPRLGELRINYTAQHSVEEEEASTFRHQQGIRVELGLMAH